MTCPKEKAKIFFFMYADFEANFGLLNHASQIYDRATKELPVEERLQTFDLYIAKATEFSGVAQTRALFERAFDVLEGKDFLKIGLRFAELEKKLGEIDRSRSIYQHLS